MPVDPVLEIACFSLDSAIAAQAAGADRIELCEDYEAGGVTPAREIIAQAKAALSIPLHVMVRPRAGDFVYAPDEIEQMQETIRYCRQLGVNGVVFGILTPGQDVDEAACEQLIALARPMSVTFHRAVDECRDLKAALQSLVRLGINRVLTSGRAATAVQGLNSLSILQKSFGGQIGILPGGGIRSANLPQLLSSGCSEYHSAAMSGGTLDPAEVSAMKQLLRQHRPQPNNL